MVLNNLSIRNVVQWAILVGNNESKYNMYLEIFPFIFLLFEGLPFHNSFATWSVTQGQLQKKRAAVASGWFSGILKLMTGIFKTRWPCRVFYSIFILRCYFLGFQLALTLETQIKVCLWLNTFYLNYLLPLCINN